MEVIDPGHKFQLNGYDGGNPQILVFMKREGSGYPFNMGFHAGTNCQEVIRALIERVKYLQKQIPCEENNQIIYQLRESLRLFEVRAAKRRGVSSISSGLSHEIELLPTCSKCGHIICQNDCTGEEHRTVSLRRFIILYTPFTA